MGRNTNAVRHPDALLIEQLGGCGMAARILGIEGKHPQQRVANWMRRGIPASVKLQHYKLLVKKPARQQVAA